MKNYNQVEVILFPSHSLTNLRQKELVRWLGTTAQIAIGDQQVHAKKITLRFLKDSPAIYLS
jgi:hypothetical protein